MHLRTNNLALPQIIQTYCKRQWHDRSQVPRIVDDRRKREIKIHDMGYYYRYHRPEIDQLPRIPDCRDPLFKPKFKVKFYLHYDGTSAVHTPFSQSWYNSSQSAGK